MDKKASGKALLPFGIFVGIYLATGMILNFQGVEMAFYQLPAPVAAILGILVAFAMFSGKMDQKICNVKHRIILILADGYIYNSAILLHNYAMHCHWKSNPLIFLHSTVVMSVKISQIRILI